ncbi:beta-glucosidase [Candidatus Uhrbacteria bacterium CG_4_9_14_3_um_filter_36_7]|uniref:beta-glucosidase n=1 Tax=Candidatus Uhrbacteria bacterium CG_4_9_14_3_um_filter_36_7 TaxID=1975033 RepID=A0A2M7XHT4_9BACT|nr:MAG: beta-glucosidase [Candidatus Uhrbacteria bacterium CG_4_9_14_3_um_filter_36_7]
MLAFMKIKYIFLLLTGLFALIYWSISSARKLNEKSVSTYSLEKNEDQPKNNSKLPYQDSSLSSEERVNNLLSRMTESEKIGQMALVERKYLGNINDIAQYKLGALLSGAGSLPEPNTPQGWTQMINSFQEQTQQTRLQIPLLYGVDAVHGHGNLAGATIFPHQIGLGATHDENLIKRIGEAVAKELRATGIYWNFAPSLDIATDNRWGRTYETFGSNPDLVSRLGRALIQGLQTTSTNEPIVMATAKHYLGAGATKWGTSTNQFYFLDQGQSTITEEKLRSTHLTPFKAAISEGVFSIMAGLHSWNGEKMAGHSYLLTEVLKNELGFKGFIVSDWHGVNQINPTNKYESVVKAINSGIDMVMIPDDYKEFFEVMYEALAKEDISQKRLNDAVSRILLAKFQIGLFEKSFTDQERFYEIDLLSHKELAREAVRKSVVLLKDTEHVLPLSKNNSHILVAGSSADNLGRQSGGWTIEWQGINGNQIPGTTILQAIKQTVDTTTVVEYSEEAKFPQITDLADIGIAVVGEKPYAEGEGDQEKLHLSTEDLLVIERLKQKSKKLIVLLICGRPIDIKNINHDIDVIITAWLPGTQGSGVTDVIFGDHPFTGILPIAWPIE